MATPGQGLEFIGRAHFAQVIAKAQGMGISAIEQFIFVDQDEDDAEHRGLRIRFASGFAIAVVKPGQYCGLQGIVVIDAAFHRNCRP
jgi:phage FluMu gp28-like protein